MSERWKSPRLRGLAALVPTLLLLGAPAYGQQPEIPEHPKPGQALPPGFVSPDPPFEERIIWMDTARARAMFIPQAIFDQYALEELPLTEEDREVLEGKIRMSRPIEDPPPYPWWRPMPKCSWPRHGGPSEPWPSAIPMEQLIQEEEAAFVGEVVAVVQGWDTWLRYVSTAIYYRIDDILLDPKNHLREGEVLSTHSVGGEITIDKVEVCSYWSKGFYRPVVGDRMLLSGQYGESPDFFQATFRFPVVDDEVLPQPIGRLLDREPQTLEGIKLQLKEMGK